MTRNIAYTWSNIWKTCCKAVFEHQSPSLEATIRTISTGVANFLEANSQPSRSHNLNLAINPHANSAWSPSTGNTIKVNVDAAWNPRSGLVGIGILLRDSQSRFLAAMTTITNATSALDAKALAVLWGCEFVEERCKRLVDFEFDSRCVI